MVKWLRGNCSRGWSTLSCMLMKHITPDMNFERSFLHLLNLLSHNAPAALLRMECSNPPRFLGDPCVHAPLFDPGGPTVPNRFSTAAVAFRTFNYVGYAFSTFGALSRDLHAPCVHFAARVTPGPRNTRFRLVANLGRAGLATSQVALKISAVSFLSFYMTSPFSRLGLAQGTVTINALG